MLPGTSLLQLVLSVVIETTEDAQHVCSSSLFLGVYCASGWLGACIAQRLFLMKDVRWFYPWLAIPGNVSSPLVATQTTVINSPVGLASLIEVPARRRELALYCLPKAIESSYAVLKKYNKIPQVRTSFPIVCSKQTLLCRVDTGVPTVQ